MSLGEYPPGLEYQLHYPGHGLSGLELHRRLLDHGDRTSVIYLSASDDPNVEVAARLLGCADYIQKGAPPKTMLSALARVREGRSLESGRTHAGR